MCRPGVSMKIFEGMEILKIRVSSCGREDFEDPGMVMRAPTHGAATHDVMVVYPTYSRWTPTMHTRPQHSNSRDA